MDLTGVIESSLANAGLTGTDDAGDGAVGGGETPEVEATDAPAAVEDAGAAPTGDPAPAVDAAASEAPVVEAPAAPKKKQGPIPFDRHEKILENARTAHATEKAALEGRLNAVAWAEHPEAQARVRAMGAADTHPELFAKALLNDGTLGPVFRKLIQGDAPAAPPVQADGVAHGERPKPNVVDEKGNLGYDEAGLDALLKWTAAQGAAQAQAAFEAKYGKEIEPLVKDRKTREAWNADVARADQHITEARREWDGFAEAEGDIKKFLLDPANRGKSLHQAYQSVVVKARKMDEAKMREKIYAEMNGKAKAAQPRPAAASAAPVSGGKKDLADVIRASISGLE